MEATRTLPLDGTVTVTAVETNVNGNSGTVSDDIPILDLIVDEEVTDVVVSGTVAQPDSLYIKGSQSN